MIHQQIVIAYCLSMNAVSLPFWHTICSVLNLVIFIQDTVVFCAIITQNFMYNTEKNWYLLLGSVAYNNSFALFYLLYKNTVPTINFTFLETYLFTSGAWTILQNTT